MWDEEENDDVNKEGESSENTLGDDLSMDDIDFDDDMDVETSKEDLE